VSDPVDGVKAVADADRVQSVPALLGADPGVDLQVQVPVRIAGPRGVVPHRDRLDLLHRDLHLRSGRADPRGRVIGEPAENLFRRAVLRGVIRRRNTGINGGGE
jgi:hypothetical protein